MTIEQSADYWRRKEDARDPKQYRQQLRHLCTAMIETFGRAGGVAAYQLLLRELELSLPEEDTVVVEDMLEALTGQCHRDCWMGTGDYHLGLASDAQLG